MENKKTEKEDQRSDETLKAAWCDDDDDIEIDLMKSKETKQLRENLEEDIVTGDTYEERLRSKYQSLQDTPDWAQITEDNKENDEDEILRTTHSLVSSKSSKLPKGSLGVTRMTDANDKDPYRV